MPITFRGFSASKNILQDLDSFPEDSDSQRKLHKIVKKQMAVPDCRQRVKSKRSALDVVQGTDDGAGRRMANGADDATDNIPNTEAGRDSDSKARNGLCLDNKDHDHVENGENKPELCKANGRNAKPDGEIVEAILRRLKELAVSAERFIPDKELLFWKKESSGGEKEAKAKENTSSASESISKSFKLPDENDIHCYYECEALPYGCMKLRHMQCPRGEFFSLKQMRCLKMRYWRTFRRKKSAANGKKLDLPEPNPEEPEPANEWLDATQSGGTQKIPPEFKPKRKPTLKIYHLRVKRKSKGLSLGKKQTRKRHVLTNLGSTSTKSQGRPVHMAKGVTKRHRSTCRHHPRSFLIRINKKEGKRNRERITESDENDSDGDNEEGDEEEDDDEDAEEDEEDPEEEETTEEGEEKIPQKLSRKDSIKEFFRSAKAAVTNRAKFTEPSVPSAISTNKDQTSSLKISKPPDSSEKSKQVLLDANIKVDGAFSNALKNMLKSKQKANQDNPMVANEGLISDRGSQDQLDPELLRVYQHLIRNNPRVKRYFLANCTEKKN